jgi:Prophage CP4-57 regulatory protein (AlpA)
LLAIQSFIWFLAPAFNRMKEQLKMKLIDSAGLKARGIDLDSTTIWRKEKAGEFPKHVLVGNRRVWVETEIDAYIEGLVAKRDAKEAA